MYQPTQLVFCVFALLPALLSSLCNGNEIASCVQVECPISEGTTSTDCHIANQTFVLVGVTSFSVSIPAQEDLSLAWTVGFQNYDNIDPSDSYKRNIERVYYLGTPPSVNFTADDLGYSGCAFYMTLPENKNLFYDTRKGPSLGYTSSYCQAALGDQCISSLESKLSALAGAHTLNSPVSSTCSKIASDLQSNLPSSCATLDSALVHGVALTGPTAAEPLTSSQNSTTNCYPTLPKSNLLTRQFSYNISASMYANETGPAAEGETPILSLFWSNEGDRNASIENPSVQLSCLRPIDMTTAAADNANDGGKKGGAVPTNGGSSLLRAAVSAGAAVLFLSWLI